MTNVLNKIKTSEDVKKLSDQELNVLAEEIRPLIINKVNTIGGHMGPNLGMVEATIALHYVFDSPKDKFIFDVSHQCYAHKILTGRKDGFTSPDNYLKYSGFTNPAESEHDLFVVGHTSTSVSLATGVAKARDLKHEQGNVITIIGDGSLSGGEALEGLDNAAMLGTNIIILVNDNEMSIAENYGGLYNNLELLRKTNGKAELNFFKSLGFDYIYLEDGNNIEELIKTFEKVKNIDHPIVVHMHTLKGKGLKQAEDNKEMFHWIMPGMVDDWNKKFKEPESYVSITKDFILNKVKQDEKVFAVAASTPGAYGFTPDYRQQLGDQYVDVGIAEEHAVAFTSALAKSGAKPVLSLLSSFVQRTYDQLSQDLALNNSPVTILIHWGAIYGADMTHLGCFDIPLISNIPNLVYLAPTCKEEYLSMLEWSVEQDKYPTLIRVPFGELKSSNKEFPNDYSKLNKYSVDEEGEKVALIGLGNFYHLAKQVKDQLKKHNINATLINPRFVTGIDEEVLNRLTDSHKLIVTLEDGVLDGGFGEKITRYFGGHPMNVLNYGAKKEFTDRCSTEKLYERYHLKPEIIVDEILENL